MNSQNLRKPRSTSEAREWGRSGGIKSGESRRRKKSMAEILDRILNEKITDIFILDDIQKRGLPVPDNPTFKDCLVGSIVLTTVEKGRVDDLLRIMELIGEQPPQNDGDTLQAARELLTEIKSVIE